MSAALEAGLFLDGLHCAGCVSRVERRLREEPGVDEASVSFTSHRALVRYDPGRVDVDGLVAEAEVAVQVPGSEVRLATRALRPVRPMARGRLMSTAIAGMLGLMLGVFGAFALEWWRQEPSMDEEIEAVAEEVQANRLGN